METAILTVKLPKADITFLEHYTKQHQLSISELFDDYIRKLQQAESVEEQHATETVKSRNIEEFLEKWTGFLEGVDPDEAKSQYLQEKYK